MFSIISDSAFDMIKNFGYDFKRYKIASRTVVDNPELVKKVLAEEKHLNTWILETKYLFPIQSNLKYLKCVS